MPQGRTPPLLQYLQARRTFDVCSEHCAHITSPQHLPGTRKVVCVHRLPTLRMTLLWLLILGVWPACAAPSPQPSAQSMAQGTFAREVAPNTLQAYGQTAVRMSQARKRAFKRAQARVLRDGTTAYKGRIHDSRSLSLQYVGTRQGPRVSPKPSTDSSGLKVVSWNCGGFKRRPISGVTSVARRHFCTHSLSARNTLGT